MMEIFFKGKK